MGFWTSASNPYAERAKQWRAQEKSAKDPAARERYRSQAQEFEKLARQRDEQS